MEIHFKDFLSKRDEAKILCGDFNLLPTTTGMKLLEAGMRNLITEYHILKIFISVNYTRGRLVKIQKYFLFLNVIKKDLCAVRCVAFRINYCYYNKN